MRSALGVHASACSISRSCANWSRWKESTVPKYDLDAMFPKGVVDEATRREVLTELLRITRRGLTKNLRESQFFTLLATGLLTYSIWALTERDANPWFWAPFAVFQGVMLVLWAIIWCLILTDRDELDSTIEGLAAVDE